MTTLKARARFVCLGIALAAIGCGSGDGPKVVSVKGNVTVGGSEPFADGWVRFSPASGSKNTGGSARTDEEGNYTLKHTSLKSGVEPGEYNVSFSLMQFPDGSPLPDQSDTRDPKTPLELGGVEFVPPEYSNITVSKYPTTVPAEGGTFDFDIPVLKAQKKK
jgi:hypothetical protein